MKYLRTALAVAIISTLLNVPANAGSTLLTDAFSYANGLITNEYAYWNPNNSSSKTSSIWNMTSGSMFEQSGAGWTGVPDDRVPNALSTNGTNSAVFRLNTKRKDFGDVAVSFSLLNQGLKTSPSTPAQDWDGLHIWLRYQSEEHLYYASFNRRDNKCIIKKKIPGGPSNGGTYYDLCKPVSHNVPYGSWQSVKATVQNDPGGSVTIKLYNGSTLIVSATDNGTIGGAPIRAAGSVGMRGDNANLKFKNFTVTSLTGGGSVPPAPAGVVAVPGNTSVDGALSPAELTAVTTI